MPVLSYSEYASDLRQRIFQLRNLKNATASIEIAICRNAFCYKSSETIGAPSARAYFHGPLNSPSGLVLEDGTMTEKAIDAFFELPEIYAYSDKALAGGRSPLSKAHWDGTLALIEVKYETARATWHQRMLLIGFEDPIHADFTIGLDGDLFVNEDNKGTQLFEWRAADVADSKSGYARLPQDAIVGADEPSFLKRLTAFARRGRGYARFFSKGAMERHNV